MLRAGLAALRWKRPLDALVQRSACGPRQAVVLEAGDPDRCSAITAGTGVAATMAAAQKGAGAQARRAPQG